MTSTTRKSEDRTASVIAFAQEAPGSMLSKRNTSTPRSRSARRTASRTRSPAASNGAITRVRVFRILLILQTSAAQCHRLPPSARKVSHLRNPVRFESPPRPEDITSPNRHKPLRAGLLTPPSATRHQPGISNTDVDPLTGRNLAIRKSALSFPKRGSGRPLPRLVAPDLFRPGVLEADFWPS